MILFFAVELHGILYILNYNVNFTKQEINLNEISKRGLKSLKQSN